MAMCWDVGVTLFPSAQIVAVGDVDSVRGAYFDTPPAAVHNGGDEGTNAQLIVGRGGMAGNDGGREQIHGAAYIRYSQ
jgi:hypothetical protein